jgi:hypothetical protein
MEIISPSREFGATSRRTEVVIPLGNTKERAA